MIKVSARLSLAAAGLAALGMVGSAQAGPVAPVGPNTLVVTDATGDARGAQASTDITSVTFTTTGKTTTKKVKGKTVTTYVPDTLVASLALAAAPSVVPVTSYEIDGDTACGTLYMYYDPNNFGSGAQLANCGPKTNTGDTFFLTETPVVTGSTITWSIPFSSLPKDVAAGTAVTAIHGYVTIAEPNTSQGPTAVTNQANIDDAVSDATYKIG